MCLSFYFLYFYLVIFSEGNETLLLLVSFIYPDLSWFGLSYPKRILGLSVSSQNSFFPKSSHMSDLVKLIMELLSVISQEVLTGHVTG